MKNRISSPFLRCSPVLWLAVGLAVLAAGNLQAQLIPSNRVINWSPATIGVPAGLSPVYTNGVPYRTTIFTNAATAGCDTNGVVDSAFILGSLLLACPPGQVVYMPPGRYLLKEQISVGKLSEVTLRGAGMGKTVIIDGTSKENVGLFCLGTGNPEGTVNITSGFNKGSSNINVSATSLAQGYTFFPGCMIAIAVPDDTNFVHNLVNSPYWGAPTTQTNNLSQITMVTAVSGKKITFWPPLIWDFTNGVATANIFAPGTAFHDSIEDLTITHTNSLTGTVGQSDNSIYASQCSQCWFRNVESSFVHNYHFAGFFLNQCTIRDCYFHEAAFYGPSQGAGLLFYMQCCNSLVENNIFYRCSPAMEINGASSGNVFSYNYSYETLTGTPADQPSTIILADFDCNHGAHNIMNLWEGNIGTTFQSDSYFGSCSHQTLFRNNFTAAHALANQFLRAVDLCTWSDYFNLVGNVLGSPTVTNLSGQVLWTSGMIYDVQIANYSYTIPVIYRFGYPHLGNNDYTVNAFNPMPSDYSTSGAAPRDLNVEATILLVNNYDYIHRSVVNPTNSMPASMYYTSQPGWWPITSVWPPIGPDKTPMVSPIPAQARFASLLANGTGTGIGVTTTPPTTNSLPPTPQNLHVQQ